MYTGGAAAAEFPSLAAFRVRGARYLLAAVGLIGLAVPYASGFAAFLQPAFASAGPQLPVLGIPVIRFPGLSVPKLHPAAALPAALKTNAPAHASRPGSRTVPVVTDSYSLSASGTSGISRTNTPVDLFAKTPIVQDTVGSPSTFDTPPASPAAPATPAQPAAGTDTSPGATDTTPAAPTPTPAPARVQGRALQSVADDPPVSNDGGTISSSDPPQVEAPPVGPVTSGTDTDTVDVSTGIPAPPTIDAPTLGGDTSVTPSAGIDGATGAPTVDPPQVTTPDQPTVVAPDSAPSTFVTGDTPSTATASSGSGAAGDAPTTTGATGSDGSAGTIDGSDATTPQGVDSPPTDPAATPGSGRSPPGLVTPDSGGSAVAGDGSATVAFAPGLVTGSTVVSVSTTDASTLGLRPASAVYDLSAVDTATGDTISHFSGSPVLTISYDPSKPAPTAIYYLDPVNGPVALPSTVDTVHHTISAALPHFSNYVAASPANLALALSPQIVQTSSSTTITATVTQGGSAPAARPSTSPSAAARPSAAESPRA